MKVTSKMIQKNTPPLYFSRVSHLSLGGCYIYIIIIIYIYMYICGVKPHAGLSENRVPLNPPVADFVHKNDDLKCVPHDPSNIWCPFRQIKRPVWCIMFYQSRLVFMKGKPLTFHQPTRKRTSMAPKSSAGVFFFTDIPVKNHHTNRYCC